MKKNLTTILTLSLFFITTSIYAGTPLYSTKVDTMLESMINSTGKFISLKFADGTTQTTAGGGSGNATYPINLSSGTETTGIVGMSQGGHGSNTAAGARTNLALGSNDYVLHKGLSLGSSTTPSLIGQLILGGSAGIYTDSGKIITPTELEYSDGATSNIQNQLNAKISQVGGTCTGLVADNIAIGGTNSTATFKDVTITGTLESGSQWSTTGSSSIATGIGYNQTYTVNGTQAAWIGTGTGKFDVSGLQGGAILGSTTINYSSLLDSARKRPFLFCDFFASQGSSQSLDPFTGLAIASGALNNPAAGIVTSNHPGVNRITGSSTANSGYNIRGQTGGVLIGGGERFDFIINLSSGTPTIYMGYHDTATVAEPVDGVYMATYGSTTIYGMVSSNSVRGTTTTGYDIGTNTWVHLVGIVGSSATRVDYYAYNDTGTQLWTDNIGTSTNIPTASGRECMPNFTATTGSTAAIDILHIDWMSVSWNKDLVR